MSHHCVGSVTFGPIKSCVCPGGAFCVCNQLDSFEATKNTIIPVPISIGMPREELLSRFDELWRAVRALEERD